MFALIGSALIPPPACPTIRGMNRAAVVAQARQFRRAGVERRAEPRPAVARWWGKVLLLLLGAGLLTAAFAPAGQWYLAWVGLVPWLVVLGGCRSQRAAFGWSWVAGTFFFIANMWWMAAVTGPGMVGLMCILGLYWGYAGVIVRGAGLLRSADEDGADRARWSRPWRWPTVRLALVAAAWVAAAEWFRGTWPWHGLPWLYLGYTQSPVLTLCQVADVTGVAGVSFLLVTANGWVALWLLDRMSVRRLVPAGVAVVATAAAVVGYGQYRLRTEPGRLTDGPRVLVVQPNVPQDNSGDKGMPQQQLTDYHLTRTRAALARTPGVDLVVWSETMMPAINPAALAHLAGTDYGQESRAAFHDVQDLAFDHDAAVLAGGKYLGEFDASDPGGRIKVSDESNATYFFDRRGAMDDRIYKKIHLVPYGEFIPFKTGCPPLYKLALHLGPKDMAGYQLEPGSEDELTVFRLARPDTATGRAAGEPWRIVTPICFEDIDADLCAAMFRPDVGTDRKRADVLVNVTNDGWFAANENAQHLQAAVFRSIENRVPTARAVNTGISGFIDPVGRTTGLLAARTEGTSVAVVQLDGRVTAFTRAGQLFARACAGTTVAVVGVAGLGWVVRRTGLRARRRDGEPAATVNV